MVPKYALSIVLLSIRKRHMVILKFNLEIITFLYVCGARQNKKVVLVLDFIIINKIKKGDNCT